MNKSWLIAISLGLLLSSLSWVPVVRSPVALGWDFHLFYAAGLLGSDELYNLRQQELIEQEIWRDHRKWQIDKPNFSPFFRPAYYRLALVPLAQLPYWAAYCVWTAVQLGSFVAALVLLSRRFGTQPVIWLCILMCPFCLEIALLGAGHLSRPAAIGERRGTDTSRQRRLGRVLAWPCVSEMERPVAGSAHIDDCA